jgi:hypothetical protein
MTLEDARNIATIAAAVVALIGVIPLFRNLIASERISVPMRAAGT